MRSNMLRSRIIQILLSKIRTMVISSGKQLNLFFQQKAESVLKKL